MTTRRHYPHWLDAFVDLFADRVEAPRRLLFWVGVSAIAGALTRRVWIDEIIFRYYPNFYIVLVAPPGLLTKSTTISLGINLLRELDHVYLSADNTTYPAFIQDLAKHASEIRDSVGADARDDLWIKQCAVTAAISEFGTFFKPEDEDMVNGLTDLWDCRSLMIKDTKTSGVDVIEHPFVNLIAGTTPSWVQSKLRTQIGGWGLSSRIIFVYASEKARYVARPSKLWQPGEFEQSTRRLVSDLKQIANLEGSFHFADDADELHEAWYEEASQRLEAHNSEPDNDTWVGHFLARKQAHVQKLAMVLSCAQRDNLVITRDDLAVAIAAVGEVQEEIPQVFKMLAEPTVAARMEQQLLDRAVAELSSGMASDGLPRAVIFSRMARYVDSRSANAIIDGAIGRGLFKQLISGGRASLSLPAVVSGAAPSPNPAEPLEEEAP